MRRKPKTILVGHDLARGGRAALAAAAAMADARTHLVALHVLQSSRPAEEGLIAVRDVRRAAATRDRLAASVARELGSRSAAGVECHVAIGDVVEGLVQGALRADLLVMATGGRVGLRRLARPSVLERVLREAPVPVVVLGPRAVGGRAASRRRGRPRSA